MASAELHRRVTEQMCIDGSLDIAIESESNRRIHTRFKASDLEWLRGARVKYGAAIRVLDISAGGLLLESSFGPLIRARTSYPCSPPLRGYITSASCRLRLGVTERFATPV